MTGPMLRPGIWSDSFREVTMIELTDDQASALRVCSENPRGNCGGE